MDQLIQMGVDFIEAQGMMAFVVVILAVLMYRDQTARSKEGERQADENKRQADNFAIESRQQGEILKILRAEVANNAANAANTAALVSKVDEIKTALISEAQSISDASTQPLKMTMDNIMDTVTPLEQSLADIRSELRQLRESVDAHMDTFKSEVATKTAEIEVRLVQVEKRATQETPAIPKSTEAKAEKEAANE